MTAPNLDYIQQTLCDRLQASGWRDKLKLFLMGNEFKKILEELNKQAELGFRFTPVLKQVFRFLTECQYSNLKVIVVSQDPYNYPPQEGFDLPSADGIAFSCSNDNKIRKSLIYIFKEIRKTVYNNDYYGEDLDLKHWSNQGVLLMNSALTTQIGKVGTHYEIWKPFTQFVLETIDADSNPCVFIFMGKKAQEFDEFVKNPKHLKLHVSHPASAAYNNLDNWNCEDIFNKANLFLKEYYGKGIIW